MVSPELNKDYAGFWRRFFAYSIDSLILYVVGFSFGLLFGFFLAFNGVSTQYGGSYYLGGWSVGIAITVLYFWYFWSRHNGQTPGSKLLAIKVVREDGKEIDFGTSLIRCIGYFLAAFPLCLGFLWMLWDHKKQGWQDKLAKTVVIKTDGTPKTGVVVAVFGCYIVFVLAIVTLIVIAGTGFSSLLKKGSGTYQNSADVSENSVPGLTDAEIATLPNNVFIESNNYRKAQGLTILQVDSRLCAYATRRLGQLASIGKYDDGKGFYEDLANSQIVSAYFTDYRNVGEAYFPLKDTSVTADKIVAEWENLTTPTIGVDYYNYGCVRAGKDILIFILAERI